jgi:hypothetical protein
MQTTGFLEHILQATILSISEQGSVMSSLTNYFVATSTPMAEGFQQWLMTEFMSNN